MQSRLIGGIGILFPKLRFSSDIPAPSPDVERTGKEGAGADSRSSLAALLCQLLLFMMGRSLPAGGYLFITGSSCSSSVFLPTF